MSSALRDLHAAIAARDAELFGEVPAVASKLASDTVCDECGSELLEVPHALTCSRRVRRKGEPIVLGTNEQIARRLARQRAKPTIGGYRRRLGYALWAALSPSVPTP